MKHFLNKRHLATTVVFIIFLINVILPSAAGASPSTPLRIPTPTPQVEKTSRLLELRRELEQVPNFLQYTEYKMLKYKSEIGARATTEKSKTSADDYLIQPRGLSPLSLELTGGFNTDSFLSFNSLAGTSISTLTGMAAIDESLQLGSINAEREDTAAREERQRIDYALNKYYYDNNYVYPQSLDQLIPKYLPNIPKNFTYIKKGSSFELRFTPPPSTAMPISAVQPLTIKSHPWETMTESKPRIPEIFSLVPNDYSLAYFSSAEKFDEFETAIQKMAKPLSRIYGVGNAISYREKIFQRLGISHIPRLSDVFDEAAFISHDIDIFPNTEYALIFKVKSEISDFPSKFLTAPSGTHGKAGDYYIVASHPDLFDEISRISGTSKSLANAKDLAYILSVMEKEYDGFVYLSEAFIQKLTSPAYRINSKRRNIIAKALVDLQYVSIAYRDITGKWPLSFQQLVDEQYIAPKTIASIENYSIDENGIVSHKDWGTVYNITPVRQVPIKEVFPGERSSYDEFREQYEQYWQEFIDPVGIAILVGDHIRFHTVILPLINESRYNWLKSLAGGESAEFQFIKNPDRIPSFQIISKFNTDDILYALYKTAPQEFDENYKKCAKDYYEIRPYPRDPVSKFCTIAEKPRTEAIVLVKDMLAKQLEWNEPEELFDFIGNEATIAVGDAMEYKISDFAKFDAYFGLAIDDTEGAKKFLEHVFRWYNKEMGGNSRNDYDMGFFSFSATEPLKNSYNDVDFYVIPLGFINLYYTFLHDRFYLTISQNALNKIIDQGAIKQTWSSSVARLFDYIGTKQNVLAFVDGTALKPWIQNLIKEQWASFTRGADFKKYTMYYTEALVLAKALPNYNGTIENTQIYYRYAPTEWFDAKLYAENGIPYIRAGEKSYNMREVNTASRSYDYYYDEPANSLKKVSLGTITSAFDMNTVLAEWEYFKDFGAGLAFTEHGLDIRVAINNPERTSLDARVPKSADKFFFSTGLGKLLIAANALIALAFIGIVAILFTRRKKISTQPSQPINPVQ